MTTNVNGQLPDPDEENDVNKREYIKRALEYMDLKPKQEIQSIKESDPRSSRKNAK